MRLEQLGGFDAIRERFVPKGGCRYCGIYHPLLQCASPKNASKSASLASFSSSASDIWEANQTGAREQGVWDKPKRRVTTTELEAMPLWNRNIDLP